MQPQTVEMRVERLEARMTAIEQIPARVDKVTERVDGLAAEMKALGDRLDKKIDDSAILVYNMVTRDLGRKIDERFEEAKRHATMLHADLVERIERIVDGRGRVRRKKN